MIDTVKRLFNTTWQNAETETSANYFVRACKKAGEWKVTQSQLNDEDPKSFVFNKLMLPSYDWDEHKKSTGLRKSKWIEEISKDVFKPTHEFVTYMFSISPTKGNEVC